jgi:hypothetical protein
VSSIKFFLISSDVFDFFGCKSFIAVRFVAASITHQRDQAKLEVDKERPSLV